ncbi:MAG: DNA gyrase inhibitor YacG [Betaproteobacteria bacterium]
MVNFSKPTIVACPRCAKPVEWTNAAQFRPFCSERCKTRDLGAWASEEYRVAGEPLPDGVVPTHVDIADDA